MVLDCRRTSNLNLFLLQIFCTEPEYYSVRINCGGKAAEKYEDDEMETKASTFHRSNTNWAFSSTGVFMNDERPNNGYMGYDQEKVLKLPMQDSQLYKDARLSPLSLTYYAFCLETGSYNVSLHFSEIMFKDNNSYFSLGRRYFDVYVQVSECGSL